MRARVVAERVAPIHSRASTIRRTAAGTTTGSEWRSKYGRDVCPGSGCAEAADYGGWICRSRRADFYGYCREGGALEVVASRWDAREAVHPGNAGLGRG